MNHSGECLADREERKKKIPTNRVIFKPHETDVDKVANLHITRMWSHVMGYYIYWNERQQQKKTNPHEQTGHNSNRIHYSFFL